MVERSGTGSTVAPDKKKEGDKTAAETQHEDPAQRLRDEGNTQARPDTRTAGNTADGLPPVTVVDQSRQPKPGDQGVPGTPPREADLPKPRQLNDETIKKYADELHKAVTKEGWFSHDPDKTKIFQLLNSLGEADRKALEDAYVNAPGNKGHKTLREELKDRLGDGEDWRKAEARLNTRDNRTNDAGNLMVALTGIKDNRGDSERKVIEAFATLNSEQRKKLDEDFKKDYGMTVEEALKKYGVSEDGMKAVNFVNKPIDQRTSQDIQDFAKFAVEKGSMDYLAIALRGDTPAAVEARKALQGNEEFVKKLVEALKPKEEGGFLGTLKKIGDYALGPVDEIVDGIMKGDLTWGKALGGITIVEGFNDTMSAIDAKKDNMQLMIAMDYLREGHPSLSTIALNNSGSLFGWFDNKDNIKLAVDNATQQERDAFRIGKQVADSGKPPATDEEKNALAYYQQTQKAFEASGDKREQAEWAAKLTYGKDSVQAKIAGSDNANGRFSALENMTESEWKALKANPAGRADLDKFLSTFVDNNERTRMMQIVDGKLGKETFDEAKGVRRTLDEVIEQNKGSRFLGLGTSYDGKNIANAIATMSPEEAEKYKTNEAFRKKVDDFVKENLGDNEKAYTERLLKQVAQTGKTPEIGQPEKILQNQMNGVDSKTAVADIEKLLADPETRKRLSGDPAQMSPDDKALRQAIDKTINSAIINSPGIRAMMYAGEGGGYASAQMMEDMQKRINAQLFEKGTVPPNLKAELNLKNERFFEDAAALSKEDREKLFKSGNVTKEEQQLIETVANQGGKLNLEDKMRAFVLGNGASLDEFKGTLAKLTDEEKQSLKENYAKKYGHTLEEDFLGKVDKKDQQQIKDLLTPGKLDGRQDYYDNLEEYLKSRSGGGLAPDATGITVERAINDQAALNQWFNHQFERMPQDVQDAARAYFKDALEQHKQSKEKMAEILATVAITAAALAATPFTGGASLALVASIAFVAGGVAKVAIHRAVEGGDYDWGKALGQFAGGGSEAALNFIGGKIVEGMFKGFNVAGKALYADMAGAGILGRGAEEATVGRAFTKLIAEGGKNVTDDGLAAFVKTVAPNATAEEAAAIRAMAQKAVAQNYDAILNRATRVALGGVDNAIIGAGAGDAALIINAAIEGRAVTAEELLKTALIGGATGAVVGTVLRGAIEGRDIYVQSKRTPQGDVIVPSGPGERPIKLRDSQGNVREVTSELKPKPDEVIIDGPHPDPRIAEPLAGGDGRTIAVDGKGYKSYDLTGPDGAPITIDKTRITLGRSSDADFSVPGNNQVSRFNSQIEFTPDGPRIKDLNSANGTYVNGQLVPKEGVILKPGDRIQLAKDGPTITFGEKFKPDAFRQHGLEINGQTVPIDKPKITLGRSTDADVTFSDPKVSRRHAEIEFTDKGPMIRDVGSGNGTYVNGKRIEGEVKLNPGDKVRVGDQEFVFRDNKFESVRPHEIMEYKPQGGRDNAANPDAVRQGNEYKENGEVRGKIQDGFQMLSGKEPIRENGQWRDPHRPSTVVDRTQDAVLNETIREAHQRFDKIAERIRTAQTEAERIAAQKELATELAKYSKDKLHPPGFSENDVDNAYNAFRNANPGKRVLLGDHIARASQGQGAGVCQHQALLFKVLADDFNLDAALVAGTYGRKPPGGYPLGTQANHAWNEVTIGGQRYVFDPRQEHFFKTYDQLGTHTPAREYSPGMKPREIKFEDVQIKRGDTVDYDGTRNWVVDSFNPRTGDVVLTHAASRPVTPAEFRAQNGNVTPEIGKTYAVRRSNGNIEQGWQYVGQNPDGSMRMYKPDGFRTEVPRTELAKENPFLVKGNRGEQMMPPDEAGKALADPNTETSKFLDAAEATVVDGTPEQQAALAQHLRERIANDPSVLEGANLNRTMEVISTIEDAATRKSAMEALIDKYARGDRPADELLGLYHSTRDASTKELIRASISENIAKKLETASLADLPNLTKFAEHFKKSFDINSTELGASYDKFLRRISETEARLTPEQFASLRAFQKDYGSVESSNFLGLYERALAAKKRGNLTNWDGWRIDEPLKTPLNDKQLDSLWNVLEVKSGYTFNPVPEGTWDSWLNRFGVKKVRSGSNEYHLEWKHNNERVKYANGDLGSHPSWHGGNAHGLKPVYARNLIDGLISLGVVGRLP